MKRLVIGTTNRGKVRQVVGALASVEGLVCVPIDLVCEDLPLVEEVGASAEDVAAVKAVAYSTAIGQPVLSLDHWLYFPEASVDDQPLARVRRIPGHDDSRADDEQVIAYYSRLCDRYGGRLTAQWHLGIAYAERAKVRTMTVITRRRLVPEPSPTRMPGLPLSALQVDLDTGRYISEHEAEDERSLWQRVYGPSFANFVTDCVGHGRS